VAVERGVGERLVEAHEHDVAHADHEQPTVDDWPPGWLAPVPGFHRPLPHSTPDLRTVFRTNGLRFDLFVSFCSSIQGR
jgi:hypothetical protein